MARINDHYRKLTAGYLFPEIARRVDHWQQAHPDRAGRIIRCGIGDVTEPLPAAVRAAMHRAIDEMGDRATFRGYGPPTGYDFLRRAIAEGDFAARGVTVDPDEIFISDGSKTDCGAILDILACGPADGGRANRIGITDPVYPVYVDTNVMAGNTGPAGPDGRYAGLVYLDATVENGFTPPPPDGPLDVVYLCYPNNPTGGMIDRAGLEAWVAWARRHDALILYDVAYRDFIRDPARPHSIYEIDGARTCAIEFHSFSKNGGFTGVRCGYTVCPRDVAGRSADGSHVPLHPLWTRRWSTKSNNVAYVVQRGAEALYSPEGRAQTAALIDHYMGNARRLIDGLRDAGFTVHGGEHAPYVWVECPPGTGSWATFDRLLDEVQVVVTPGAGFGRCGEGFFRVSAFNSRANVDAVVNRLSAMSTVRA